MMDENIHDIEELDLVELSDDELEEVAGGKKSIYVKAKVANIRSGPGKEYAEIWAMGRDDELVYLGEKKKDKHGKLWIKVKAVHKTGWIRADLVKKHFG